MNKKFKNLNVGIIIFSSMFLIAKESYRPEDIIEVNSPDALAQKLKQQLEEVRRQKEQEQKEHEHTTKTHTLEVDDDDDKYPHLFKNGDDDDHGLTEEELEEQMQEMDKEFGAHLNKNKSSFTAADLKNMFDTVPDDEDQDNSKEDDEIEEEWEDDENWDDEDDRKVETDDSHVEEEGQNRLDNAVDVLSNPEATQAEIIKALDTSKVPTVNFNNENSNSADPISMQQDVDNAFFEQFAKEMSKVALDPKISKGFVQEKGDVLITLHSELNRATNSYKNIVEDVKKYRTLDKETLDELIKDRDEIFEGVDRLIKRIKKGMISKEMKETLTTIENALKINVNRAIYEKLPSHIDTFDYDRQIFNIRENRITPVFNRFVLDKNKESMIQSFEQPLPRTFDDLKNAPVTAVRDNIDNVVNFIKISTGIAKESSLNDKDYKSVENTCLALGRDKPFLKTMQSQYKDLATMVKDAQPTNSFGKIQKKISIERLKTTSAFLKKPTLEGFKAIEQEMKFFNAIRALEKAQSDNTLDQNMVNALPSVAPKNMKQFVKVLQIQFQPSRLGTSEA